MSRLRSFVISILTFVVGLIAVDVGFGRYASAHYVPEQRFRLALAEGDGCILAVGDSRMVAGVDSPALERALASTGTDACVATIAIGALKLSGQVIALRRYLELRRPKTVVLGVSEGSLLPEAAREDPASMVGNRALELTWSNGEERSALYPSWDLSSLDARFRHRTRGATALGSFASFAWLRLQALEDRLVGPGPSSSSNQFGLLSDMRALEKSFQGDALDKLARWDGRFPRSYWLDRARELAGARGARVVVVAVPMPSAYRIAVSETPAGRRYRDWLEQSERAAAGRYVDLSATVADADFQDAIHLAPRGAIAFSTALAAALAEPRPPSGR